MSSEVFFPEFQNLPSSVTILDMKVVGMQRLTVFGCQNGFLKCCLVDITAGSKLTTSTHHIILCTKRLCLMSRGAELL